MKRNCIYAAFMALFIGATVLLPASMEAVQPDKKPAEKPEPGRGRGYKEPAPGKRAHYYRQSAREHGRRLERLAKFSELPASFDTREKGWVHAVGNQGSCGSCYLYSTIYGTMTSAFIKAGYGKNDGSLVMSVQYGMDCHNFGGCGGGWGTEVIDWACKNGWPAERWTELDGDQRMDYPEYSASSRACRKVTGAKYWKPASWGFVSASDTRPATTLEIKTALVNFGPLNVAVDAGGQFGNGTGTITSLGRSIDHEIELVAYDDEKDGGAFLLRNQWGTGWGNNGYRWCTYKAAQNLVDIFFVSVNPLPPPIPPLPPDPLPPIPPGPTPNGTTVITIDGPVVVGGHAKGEFHALGTDALLSQLFSLRNMPKPGPGPTPEPPVGIEARLDALERARVEDRKVTGDILESIRAIQKVLGGK